MKIKKEIGRGNEREGRKIARKDRQIRRGEERQRGREDERQ